MAVLFRGYILASEWRSKGDKLSEIEVTETLSVSVTDLLTIYAGNLINHIFSSRSRKGISFFIMPPLLFAFFSILGRAFHNAPHLFRLSFFIEFLTGLYVG